MKLDRLRYRLVAYFIFISLVSISIVSYLAFHYSKEIIVERTYSHLQTTIILKEQEIDLWVGERKTDVQVISELSLIKEDLTVIQSSNESNKESSYSRLRNNLEELMFPHRHKIGEYPHKHILELFIMDPVSGEVMVSTDSMQEGKFKSNRPYFKMGQSRTYVQSIYHSTTLGSPAMTISTPIKDDKGGLIGVLAARLSLDGINEVMLERTGLGRTGETYLVNKYNYFVTDSKSKEGFALRKTTYTEVVKRCLEKQDDMGLYPNYRGVPVIGVYHWMDEEEMCLLAEIEQEEAFIPIKNLQRIVLILALAMVFISVLLGVFFTRRVIFPLRRLVEGTKKIALGNLTHRVEVDDSGDEISELASSFNKMTSELQTSQKELEDYTRNLEEKIGERTKSLSDKIEELSKTRLAMLNMMEDLQKAKTGLEDNIKERTKELQRAYDELKEADRLKDDFLAVTSHELKTPLTSIIGLTQLMQEELADRINEDEKEDINVVLDEAKRLRKLIEDILELARLDAGKQVFNMGEVDIKKISDEIAQELKAFSEQKKININVEDIDAEAVRGDYESIKRLLINLTNNAVKYSSGKGENVTIGAYQDKDKVVTFVRDEGIGIPDEAKKKVFDRFYQVDSSKSRKYGGTGLGLAICKKIVEAHNGEIWFKSKVGEGTTFYFTLPIFNKEKKEGGSG